MSLLFAFDLDDVLYGYNWRQRMADLSAATGLEIAEMRTRWWHREGEGAAEAGAYRTGAEYLEASFTALGVRIDPTEWLRIRGAAMTPWPESIEAARRAAELGRVTLLTNNGAFIGESLPQLAPELVPIFGTEHLRATAYYGARKPDPRVYERMLAAYGATPAETFFADDRIENVESAAALGITAHHFQGAAGLLDAIETFALARAA